MTKAECSLVDQPNRNSEDCFRIRIFPDKPTIRFDASDNSGELFAAELEALANKIRSRGIRARMIGEDSNTVQAN